VSGAASVAMHEFATSELLATNLAQTVAEHLRTAIAEHGAATLVVSGGTTPKRFFAALSHQELDWSRVNVTLADERWVDASSPRSNAKLVAETLLQNEAASARFVPLFDAAFAAPDAAIPALTQRLKAIGEPFDVVMLGMGDDGHFASLFPGGDHLQQGLDPTTTALLVSMHAANAGEPRISLTLPPLLATRHLILHIEGAGKRATLERAMSEASLPIHHLLQQRRPPLPCFWCA
jgi:6-phosphogluconolactonase